MKRACSPFVLLCLVLSLLANASLQACPQQDSREAVRTWSDQSGSFRIEATLIELGAAEVKLKRADNQQIISVPLDRLSKADVAWLEEWKKAEGTGELTAMVDPEPWLKKTNWVKHHVVMKANLSVPGNRKPQLIQLRHALPTPRSWTGNDPLVAGATNIVFSPDIGKQKYDRKEESHYIIYDMKKGIEPGTSHEFITEFDVLTCDREFDPSVSVTAWEDYGKPKKKREETQLTDDLKTWVAELKAKHSPAETLAAFCQWNATNMTYDASVQYSTDDIPTILGRRSGHCAHYCSLTGEFCAEAGIPTRRVFGLNLYAENGVGDLSRIRSDFTNVHTWIEVYLPKEGWIELEPAEKEKPFLVPSRFIQNNPEFQNYSLAFKINGQIEFHKYVPAGGGSFTSEYQFANLITYTTTKSESPFTQSASTTKE